MSAISPSDPRRPALLLASFLLLLILAVSFTMTGDRMTWLLETLPVMIALSAAAAHLFTRSIPWAIRSFSSAARS